MKDYKKLVEALRYCSTTKGMVYCNVNCKYGWEERSKGCKDLLMTDAADAIEALNRLLDQNTQRCEELRNQLREAHESYENHLNELEAQLPKRGKWIWDPNGMDWGIGSWVCKNCKARPNTYWQSDPDIKPLRFSGSHYCPNCGAKMEVCGVGY